MLLEYLNRISDKRRGQGRRYPLGYIILFSLMAIMSKADTYVDIADFIEVHLERLEEALGFFWVKSPHKDTIRNILQNIDTDELEKALSEYNQAEIDKTVGLNIMAIDGKALRKSFDNMKDQKSLHMLEIFATGSDLIIGQSEIDSKSNEIPAVQKFIKESGLDGCIFTMDAMHCQKKLLI